MKSLTFAVILLAFTAVTPFVRAQSSDDSPAKRPQEVIGEIERVGAQIQAVLTNTSDARAFQGSAKINIGLSAETAIQLTVNLAPNETRGFPLSISNPAEKQYSLAVYNQTGKLVFFKIAPITTNSGIVRETAPAPIQTAAPKKNSGDLKITTKLMRGAANQDAENSSPNQDEPILLTFEIESETPVRDANFILSSKDFQNRQQFSVEGRAALEFRLPETLSERKLNYLITSSTGQTLASGEVDLDQLPASDSVSVNALTFDHPAYAPGESARAVVELLGEGQRGYRLEFSVKDGGGNFLLKDERRGSSHAGKSRQEFTVEIPRETQGPIVISYRVFGGQTGTMFDSGSREIALKAAEKDKTSAAKRYSP